MSKKETRLPKYDKKITFSREKKYVTCEADIVKQDIKSQNYKTVRSAERVNNLRLAEGMPSKGMPSEDNGTTINTKNKIIQKIPTTNDNILCYCGEKGVVPWFPEDGEKQFLCDVCFDNVE
jgi:hypothetical protein